MNFETEKKSGFTVIEVTIVIAIFLIIMIALVTLLGGYNTIFSTQVANVNVLGSASRVVSEVQIAAAQADHIMASHTFSGTLYSSGSGTVVFELPSINSAGDIIPNTYDYFAFYTSGNNVYRISDLGSGSVRAANTEHISDAILSLTFTYDNVNYALASKIDVDVQTQTLIKQQSVGTHLHQQIYLRNI